MIAEVAAASLRHIESALTVLQAERSRLDEGDLRTIARYVATRYGACVLLATTIEQASIVCERHSCARLRVPRTPLEI
jgi:hypothetical protein